MNHTVYQLKRPPRMSHEATEDEPYSESAKEATEDDPYSVSAKEATEDEPYSVSAKEAAEDEQSETETIERYLKRKQKSAIVNLKPLKN